jgi:hypothetical protein
VVGRAAAVPETPRDVADEIQAGHFDGLQIQVPGYGL